VAVKNPGNVILVYQEGNSLEKGERRDSLLAVLAQDTDHTLAR
jgi:hypothetical protein